jgi:DNA gyrase subunit A
VVGRNTQGVRVMNLNDGDKIASLAKVAREDVEAEAESQGEPSEQPPEPQATPPEAPAE